MGCRECAYLALTEEISMADKITKEQQRLEDARQLGVPWKKWGPYLSERQWGTVREDYSQTGNAGDYFSHDQARSRRIGKDRALRPLDAGTSGNDSGSKADTSGACGGDCRCGAAQRIGTLTKGYAITSLTGP